MFMTLKCSNHIHSPTHQHGDVLQRGVDAADVAVRDKACKGIHILHEQSHAHLPQHVHIRAVQRLRASTRETPDMAGAAMAGQFGMIMLDKTAGAWMRGESLQRM